MKNSAIKNYFCAQISTHGAVNCRVHDAVIGTRAEIADYLADVCADLEVDVVESCDGGAIAAVWAEYSDLDTAFEYAVVSAELAPLKIVSDSDNEDNHEVRQIVAEGPTPGLDGVEVLTDATDEALMAILSGGDEGDWDVDHAFTLHVA